MDCDMNFFKLFNEKIEKKSENIFKSDFNCYKKIVSVLFN